MDGGYNIDGTIDPRTTGGGFMPLVGIARGGTQGRLGLMHGGIGGAQTGGGFQPGATPAGSAAPRGYQTNVQVPGLPPHIAQMLQQMMKQQGGR